MSTISSGTTSTTTLVHSGDTTGSLVFKTNDTGSGGTTAMTIDTSQNVGIGTSSPATKLNVNTSATSDGLSIGTSGTVYTKITSSGTDSNYIATNAFAVQTNGSERMRITSGGLFFNNGSTGSYGEFWGIKASANSYQIMGLQDTGTTGGNYMYFVNSAGNAAGSINHNGTTTVAYNTSSDYRMKENVQPMKNALATLAQLNPVTYKWKKEFGGEEGQGFIAHELQEVCPLAVSGEKDAVETYTDDDGNEQTRPKYQGIDTSFLVATLTAAIQELKAINDQQAQTITAQSEALASLSEAMASLTARLSALENK